MRTNAVASIRSRGLRASAALLFLGVATAALGGTQALGTVVPGAGLVKKRFLSVRELRYEHVIEQRTDFSCGAAALATILKYAYGRDNVDETSVIAGLMTVADQKLVHEQGFSLLDMKRYLESIDMRGRGYNVRADTLEKILIPTIVLLDIRGYKHFVVLKKTTGNRVYIGDPALGNRVMRLDDFVEGWNGIVFAVIGSGFDRETVLLTPREPPTVRRSQVVTSVPVPQLLEFGFTHADLF